MPDDKKGKNTGTINTRRKNTAKDTGKGATTTPY